MRRCAAGWSHRIKADELQTIGLRCVRPVFDGGSDGLPMLLDFLTVFFIVAGCALLWLNLRRRRSLMVVTETDHALQLAPTRHISDDAEIRALLAAVLEAQANPEAEENNAEARRRERNCSRRDRGSS